MGALNLPPAEPPAHDVDELRETVRTIREQIQSAEHTLARIQQAAQDIPPGAGPTAPLNYGIELWLAEQRIAAWRRVLDTWMALGRDQGLTL